MHQIKSINSCPVLLTPAYAFFSPVVQTLALTCSKNSWGNHISDKRKNPQIFTLWWCKPAYLPVFAKNCISTTEDAHKHFPFDWCLKSSPSCSYVSEFRICPKSTWYSLCGCNGYYSQPGQ